MPTATRTIDQSHVDEHAAAPPLSAQRSARQRHRQHHLEPARRLLRRPAGHQRDRGETAEHDAELDEEKLQEAANGGEVDARERPCSRGS